LARTAFLGQNGGTRCRNVLGFAGEVHGFAERFTVLGARFSVLGSRFLVEVGRTEEPNREAGTVNLAVV
jgi:hypothetical protein